MTTPLDELNELIRFMNEHGLTELEVANGEKSFRLRKGAEGGGAPVVAPVAAAPTSASVPAAPPAANTLIPIKSPMVGTFYRASAPDAKPFVDAGDPVGPETVVCIVEAMKVMNEVAAGCSGTIQKVCVENNQPVEFGQVLFLVQP